MYRHVKIQNTNYVNGLVDGQGNIGGRYKK